MYNCYLLDNQIPVQAKPTSPVPQSNIHNLQHVVINAFNQLTPNVDNATNHHKQPG